jgi:hypothetical protein
MTHRDLGVADDELGEQFKETQGLANAAESNAKARTDYHEDNCGPCNQYVDSFKSNVRKYKEGIDGAVAMGTPHPDAGKSAAELATAIYDDHKAGRAPRSDDPSVAAAYDSLTNFNNHLNESHGYTFSGNSDRYTPVVNSDENKGFARRLYDKLTGKGTGLVNPKEKSLAKNPFERTRSTGEMRDESELSSREDKQIQQIKRNQTTTSPTQIPEGTNLYPLPRLDVGTPSFVGDYDKVPWTTPHQMDRSNPGTPVPAEHRDRRIFNPSSKSLTPEDVAALEQRSEDLASGKLTPLMQRTDPGGLTKKVIELPGKTIEYFPPVTKFEGLGNEGEYTQRGGQFTVTPNRRTKEYDPSKDTRRLAIPKEIQDQHITEPSLKEGFNGGLPFIDKLLFQKAGVAPDTAELSNYWKSAHEFHNQPTQEPTGETKTVQFGLPGERNEETENNYGLPSYPGIKTTDAERDIVRGKLHQEAEHAHNTEYGHRLRDVIKKVNSEEAAAPNGIAEGTTKLDRIRALMTGIPRKYDASSVGNQAAVENKLNEWERNRGRSESVKTTREVPIMRDIPAERRIKEPSLESLRSGQQAYNNSRELALSAAYPGMDRESAIKELQNEHDTIMKAHGRRINASKRKNMFNSNNKKESATDFSALPGMIEHGLKDVGHALNTLRNQWDQARQTKNLQEQGDANGQLLAEGVGGAVGGNVLLNKYKKWVNSDRDGIPHDRPDLRAKLDFHNSNCRPNKCHSLCEFDNGKRQASLNVAKARIEALAKEKICKNCGKNCSSKEECKANMDEKRRANAAENI